jgi:hypothetical protein
MRLFGREEIFGDIDRQSGLADEMERARETAPWPRSTSASAAIESLGCLGSTEAIAHIEP